MGLRKNLNNLKKTQVWKLILEDMNVELIMLQTKNKQPFKLFIELLYKTYGVKLHDKKLIQKAILLSRFPHVFMSTNRSEYENNIYWRSKEILALLITNEVIDMKILFQKLLTFSIMYEDWEEKDKTMQIEILCETFKSYDVFKKVVDDKEELSAEDKDTYIKCINTFLNKILHTLRLLDSNWKERLLNYNSKDFGYDQASHDNMLKYFKSIFWENLYLELVVKNNYGICNYLINDYLNIISPDSVDCSALENYKRVTSVGDIYELQNVMISINRQIDTEHNYNILFNETTLISNFRKIFNRLEKYSLVK